MATDLDLRGYSLFSGLDDAAMDLLTSLCAETTVTTGHAIIQQGERGDRVHCIISGTAWVYVDGEHIANLNAGQQFGEMHLVDIQARSASVIAATELTTVSVGTGDLLALQRNDPQAALMLMLNCARDVSRRLRRMNQRFIEAQRENTELKSKLLHSTHVLA